MASLTVAYILWFFGGLFGIHHFYLRRDRQAFVWWSTCGGVVGLGWIRDLWRLPEYVLEANENEEYEKKELEAESTQRKENQKNYDQNSNRQTVRKHGETRHHSDHPRGERTGQQHPGRESAHPSPPPDLPTPRRPKPPCSTVRWSGEMIMGNILGYLTRMAIPEEYAQEGFGKLAATYLPPVGVALGVHLVANIGRQKATIKWPLIGAFIALPWMFQNTGNLSVSPLFSAIATSWWGVQWRTKGERKKSLCRRLSVLGVSGLLYLSLWTSTIYLNAYVTTKEGEQVPLREAVLNFFKSPAWAETKESWQRLYNYYKIHGWHKIWEELVEAFDPTGEANAYKVLDLSPSASQEEITAQYRKLARKWHPDRHKDPKEKEDAQEKFIEIQQSYDILSQIKTRRTEKNKKSTKSTYHTEF